MMYTADSVLDYEQVSQLFPIESQAFYDINIQYNDVCRGGTGDAKASNILKNLNNRPTQLFSINKLGEVGIEFTVLLS